MSNMYGRQVVVPMVNKSGGAVVAGDVVVIDTANDTAFTTTTSARAEVTLGVAQEAIANNATGRVLIAGYAGLVNVPASVTRGHYVETHTVAKQATGNSTRRSGSFGQFLTGGTTPTAMLWGSTDQTAGGGTTLVGGRVTRTAGNLTTSSTTFVDATGMSLTVTTGAHQVLIGVVASGQHDTGGDNISLDLHVDGASEGGTAGLMDFRFPSASYDANLSFTHMTAALSAASHTFKLRWKIRAGGNGTLLASGTAPLVLWVAEMAF